MNDFNFEQESPKREIRIIEAQIRVLKVILFACFVASVFLLCISLAVARDSAFISVFLCGLTLYYLVDVLRSSSRG